jgi:peptide deformylase
MAIRQIRVLGDDVLRKKCKEVKRLKEIREHIEECLYKDNDAFKIEHIEKVVCFSNEVS